MTNRKERHRMKILIQCAVCGKKKVTEKVMGSGFYRFRIQTEEVNPEYNEHNWHRPKTKMKTLFSGEVCEECCSKIIERVASEEDD